MNIVASPRFLIVNRIIIYLVHVLCQRHTLPSMLKIGLPSEEGFPPSDSQQDKQRIQLHGILQI